MNTKSDAESKALTPSPLNFVYFISSHIWESSDVALGLVRISEKVTKAITLYI